MTKYPKNFFFELHTVIEHKYVIQVGLLILILKYLDAQSLGQKTLEVVIVHLKQV